MLPVDVLTITDPLAWVVVALFGVGALAEGRRPGAARYVAGGAWGLFAVFWLLLVPHFFVARNSVVEALLALVAAPACVYAAYLIVGGRDSLFVLTRAVAVMGLLYLPAETVPFVRQVLVEHVADQTERTMNLLGYHPERRPIGPGRPAYAGYDAAFYFPTEDPDHGGIVYNIVLACTALGSKAVFAGCIAAVRAPWRRKLGALAVALPVIYALNVVRTTFIGLAFGHQWFDGRYAPYLMRLFGESDRYMVSHVVAEGLVSQTLSVLALVVVAWFVVRILPELLVVVDDVAFVLTGREHDTAAELGLSPAAGDGGESVAASAPADGD